MLRRCLRCGSIKFPPRLKSSQRVIRHHGSTTKSPGTQAQPSLSSRARNVLNRPFKAIARLVLEILPSWRDAPKYIFGLFLFGHIFTSYAYSFTPCSGISMMPTINSSGDSLLISKYYRRGRGIVVGDLVSFDHPVHEGVEGVKRVIGLAGDFVLLDVPGTNGKMLQIPAGHCWVVGDNLTWSRDSRLFGPLPLALIRGKVVLRSSSFTSWHRIGNSLQEAWVDDDELD